MESSLKVTMRNVEPEHAGSTYVAADSSVMVQHTTRKDRKSRQGTVMESLWMASAISWINFSSKGPGDGDRCFS
ncbi:hypothetical protein B0H67DRAFT_558887 [Lasiosphaeris hirsuta]|uniref:Uncharacterized protein n=1 Tax=Lasiosphaeris hirsuta TaxID=260670 RepID=A0AA40E758_9PEZI|nr:hypothetical protein B0H67DRAFT_558887 [Lasiosphaeris hirsuta]